MSITDYIGRTIDVLAYDGADPTKRVELQQTLAVTGEGGKIVTGIQKLVQRFLLLLFTDLGSMPYSPDSGTTFMVELRSGALQNQTDVFQAFSRAITSVKTQLRAMELDTDPDDEKFSSAEAGDVTISDYGVTAQVTLTSQASSVTFIVPIVTTP